MAENNDDAWVRLLVLYEEQARLEAKLHDVKTEILALSGEDPGGLWALLDTPLDNKGNLKEWAEEFGVKMNSATRLLHVLRFYLFDEGKIRDNTHRPVFGVLLMLGDVRCWLSKMHANSANFRFAEFIVKKHGLDLEKTVEEPAFKAWEKLYRSRNGLKDKQ